MKTRGNKLSLILTAMVLGYLSWTIPPLLIPGTDQFDLPLFPIRYITISTNNNLAWLFTVITLGLTGGLLGFLDSELGPLWAFATMIPVAMTTVMDAFLGARSHNLFPIEMFVHFLYTIPAVLGALFMQFTKWIAFKIRS